MGVRRPVGPLALADGGGCLESVHLRHLQVHEHEIDVLAEQRLGGFASVGHHQRRVAAALQQVLGQLPVDGVVLGHQHAQPPRRPRRRHRRCRRLRVA